MEHDTRDVNRHDRKERQKETIRVRLEHDSGSKPTCIRVYFETKEEQSKREQCNARRREPRQSRRIFVVFAAQIRLEIAVEDRACLQALPTVQSLQIQLPKVVKGDLLVPQLHHPAEEV